MNIDLLFFNSSLILSKINTFASTDIPIVSIIPAIPGRVKVADNKLKNVIIIVIFTNLNRMIIVKVIRIVKLYWLMVIIKCQKKLIVIAQIMYSS